MSPILKKGVVEGTSQTLGDVDQHQKAHANNAQLRALGGRTQLPILRKLLSLMEGQHYSARAGQGWEFMDMAEYKPGDDVKDIDWAATARAGKPIVKRFEASANVQVMLVVDTGRSMSALAPSGESKEAVALTICQVVAWLASSRGDQVGLVSGCQGRMRHMPARSGNAHIELILRRLEEDIDLRSPSSDLETLLARVQAATYRRSLIVLVTDETHPQPTPRVRELLKRLSVRHRLLIMQVADADPTQLPAGTRIVDVDAGPLPDFLLGDSQIAAEAAARADQSRTAVRQFLEIPGITRVSVSSSDQLVRTLLSALERESRVR